MRWMRCSETRWAEQVAGGMLRGMFWARLIAVMAAVAVAACGGDDGGSAGDGGAVGDGGAGTDAGLPEGAAARTESGVLVGEEDEGLHVYRGIPYAAPPVGELRFRAPVPHEGWDEPLDATEFGPECPQRAMMGTDVVGDEDCLTLNIWTHADGEPRPVMVFIHGGGSIQGSGSLALYDGSNLARSGDVVIVTLNYRLGSLGYLALEALVDEGEDGSAGDYGILDQIAALEWVQRNIAAFGGDPENVTIFGESAGGVSVCVHLGSPLSEGLFRRGIIESGGGCYNFHRLRTPTATHASAIDVGEQITAAAGCDGAADVLECLRGKSAEEMVDALFMADASGLGLPDIGPNVDGVVLTDDPWALFDDGTATDVPVVIGSNADEATLFTTTVSVPDEAAYEALVTSTAGDLADELLALYPASDYATPKDAYDALFSDVAFICPAMSFAAVSAGGDEPTYAYHFTKTLEGPGAAFGSFHALELFYVFGNFEPLARYTPVAVDFEVSDVMQAAWTGFGREGVPATDPAWPAYDPAAPEIAIFDTDFSIATEIREGRCAELEALGLIPTPAD